MQSPERFVLPPAKARTAKEKRLLPPEAAFLYPAQLERVVRLWAVVISERQLTMMRLHWRNFSMAETGEFLTHRGARAEGSVSGESDISEP